MPRRGVKSFVEPRSRAPVQCDNRIRSRTGPSARRRCGGNCWSVFDPPGGGAQRLSPYPRRLPPRPDRFPGLSARRAAVGGARRRPSAASTGSCCAATWRCCTIAQQEFHHRPQAGRPAQLSSAFWCARGCWRSTPANWSAPRGQEKYLPKTLSVDEAFALHGGGGRGRPARPARPGHLRDPLLLRAAHRRADRARRRRPRPGAGAGAGSRQGAQGAHRAGGAQGPRGPASATWKPAARSPADAPALHQPPRRPAHGPQHPAPAQDPPAPGRHPQGGDPPRPAPLLRHPPARRRRRSAQRSRNCSATPPSPPPRSTPRSSIEHLLGVYDRAHPRSRKKKDQKGHQSS